VDLDISGLNYYITNEAGNQVICDNLEDCPNMTYPVLLYQLLPTGVLGLVIAGLLAAMSSSISATLNSASTLITMDFVTKISPNLTSKQLVRVGQIATVALVLLAAFWTQYIEQISDSLWEYLQLVLGFIAPPVVAVFLVGLFWRRGNGNGAFAALIGGLIISAYFIASTAYNLSPALNEMHFLHKAPVLMVACMLIHFFVSSITAAPEEKSVEGLTWNIDLFRAETKELEGLPWYKNYRILAIILLIITAVVVGYFW
jgi:SSS family solute:Na+ symporter